MVRILEDLVTRDAGLPQQVRSAAKAAGARRPRPGRGTGRLNGRLAAGVRALLGGAAVEGFEVVDERWLRPGLPSRLHAAPPATPTRMPWLGGPRLRSRSLSGGVALARLDGADLDFVVNLGELKARTIELGDHGSEVPAVQEALF